MKKASLTFQENVKKLWGNPIAVAKEAFYELFFRHNEEVGLDYADQIRHAMQIGVMAGEMTDGHPEAFVQRFENEILNGEKE
ncbi:MAG: hypothetical protein WC310_04350 [Patescibacteria group bacterium]|jgi:hypothetical protein